MLRKHMVEILGGGAEAQKEVRMILNHLAIDEEGRDAPPAGFEAQAGKAIEMAQARRAGCPMAYLLGKKAFWDFELIVSEEVLIPRPESEHIVELAQELCALPPRSILDLGTGSGALLCALLTIFEGATGTGADISEKALGVARENLQRTGVDARARLVQSDWFHAIDGKFDLIVANPPYIAPEEMPGLMPDVRLYEPFEALCDGVDGLDAYQHILRDARAHLERNGVMILEHGSLQRQAVVKIVEAAEWRVVREYSDLTGHPRGIAVAL